MDDDGQHHFNDVKKIINMSKKLKLNNQVIFFHSMLDTTKLYAFLVVCSNKDTEIFLWSGQHGQKLFHAFRLP